MVINNYYVTEHYVDGMTDTYDADWFAARLSDTTARGIAVETSALIRSGVIPSGTRLPAIRALAYRLGVSPATISSAWSDLRRQKMVVGRGRNGTWVPTGSFSPRPNRMGSVGRYDAKVLDLSLASPDPTLLPPLSRALSSAAEAEGLNSYVRTPILGQLLDTVRPGWPCAAEAFLATNGGYNAIYALLHALVLPGAFVAIEEPTAMRILDIIEDLGARILPVACDAEGPVPAALAEVLEMRPTVFIFQPRTHSVTAATVSAARMADLAAVLRDSETLVIEDDGVGDASAAPRLSLGAHIPDKVVHILSYSKSLGPDLRLAVLSGPARVVEQVQAYRSFSAGWTSRLLQATAAWLLTDADTEACLVHARATYAARRARLRRALSERGIDVAGDHGLCLWAPVWSEQFAMVTLAARGIAVLPGSKSMVGPSGHVRVATSVLTDRFEEVADAIALACQEP